MPEALRLLDSGAEPLVPSSTLVVPCAQLCQNDGRRLTYRGRSCAKAPPDRRSRYYRVEKTTLLLSIVFLIASVKVGRRSLSAANQALGNQRFAAPDAATDPRIDPLLS
jgi:hypothetical protein